MHSREIDLEGLTDLFESLPMGAAKSVVGLIRRYSHTLSRNQKIVAFYEGDELVCVAMWGLVPKRNYVNLIGMAIPDRLQRQGVGRKVLREVAARAKAAGLENMKTQAYNPAFPK